MKAMKSLWLAALLAGTALAPSMAPAQTAPAAAPFVAPSSLASDPKKHSHDPIPPMVEGQPIETGPTEKPGDKPLFPGQTRAPYSASGVAYKVTVLPIKLTRGGSIGVLPDGKVLVAERGGILRTIDPKGVVSDPISGLPAMKTVRGGGLIEVTVDPSFARTRRLYLSYDVDQGNEADGVAVARAALSPDGKALTGVTEIFRVTPAMTSKQGNGDKGGRIAVDRDGNLFVALGGRPLPGAQHSLPQDLDNTIGKIVHITPDGKPVPGAPFIGKAGARPEIWTSGHRNPTGLAFDARGQLWEVEMGPRGGDELNKIERGKNYGWPVIAHGLDDDLKPVGEGLPAKEGLEQPRYYWDPVIAPAGMAFYDGPLFPKWKGSFLVGALRGERLVRLTVKDDKVVSEEPLLTELRARIRDVRVGPDGAVYVLTDDDAYLLKITPK
jgi:glucose/arabinose dehydrogenase